MTDLLEDYSRVVGQGAISHLQQLTHLLKGIKVVHINSTKEGGGVAEILNRLIPLKRALGLDAEWEIITGEHDFYQCTKKFHNTLQGNRVDISQSLLDVYEVTNRNNAEKLGPLLENADVVFIHDPQPAPLLSFFPHRKGKWIWRCHIDMSHPYRPIWKYLRKFVEGYDASVWSLSEFAQPLPHPLYLIPPSIDPLSEKNKDIEKNELTAAYSSWGLDPERPIVTQVSRFDRFKDPFGVIAAYKMVKKFIPIQLVLAGGGATDDPEGQEILKEVITSAGDDPDIHVLLLPSDAHRTINILQRISHIVLQKSIKEGFGLTVSEAMWKEKPVIGGEVGGIRLQIFNHHTGYLVNSPEGAALRIRYLLKYRDKLEEIGKKAKQFVLENFLITRQLREYLTLMVAIMQRSEERIEL
jgi:trehalose synthase